MNGRVLALGALAGLAAAGLASRRGSWNASLWDAWTVEDTEHLVRALDALRIPCSRWAHHAAPEYKQAILDTYERLPAEQQDAMQKAIRLSWQEEGFLNGQRPLFRTPNAYEREHPGGPVGGLSLSHQPTSGRAWTTPGEGVRVFLVSPGEVLLDSRVPRPHTDGWYARFNAWDPPTYDRRTGEPTNRRSQLSARDVQYFGWSPVWTLQYGAEDEVILRAGARPPEISYLEYLARQKAGSMSQRGSLSSAPVTFLYISDSSGWADLDSDLDDADLDRYDREARDLAHRVGIGILRGKDLRIVALNARHAVVGALFDEVGHGEDAEGNHRQEYSFDVVVDPSTQRTGIGSALVQKGLAIGRENEEAGIVTVLDAVNPVAQAMFVKRGFRVVRRQGGHAILERKVRS